MKLDYIRSTMLKSYLRCPHRFKLEFIDSVEARFPEEVHRGSRLHKAMELYIKGDPSFAEKQLASDDERGLYTKIVETLKMLPEADLRYPIWRPKMFSEVHFEEYFEGLPRMTGIFDIVMIGQKRVRIIDLKTGWRAGKYDGIQMTMYLMAGKQIWKPWEVSVAMWILKKGEIQDEWDTVGRGYIETLVETIEKDTEFQPISGYKTCKGCPFEYCCEKHYKRR